MKVSASFSPVSVPIVLGLCLCLFGSVRAVFRDDPTVLVTLLVRNKAHTLPYFLKLFEELDYPKDRMSLWIKSEENQDKSIEILQKWIPSVEGSYHSIYHKLVPSGKEETPTKWTPDRFAHIIELKEEALMKGREMWADWVWFLDSDVFLTSNQTLRSLVVTNYPVVAPMLDSLSLYSNFWCGMGTDYYYRRTEEYVPIREREKKGCYRVMLVHTAFMIDLRQVEALKLTFKPEKIKGYEGPEDDLIVLAIAAYWNDIPVYVCNHERFGYVLSPMEDDQTIKDDLDQLLSVKQEASVYFPPMEPHRLLTEYVTDPPKDKLGFSEVFLINLERRPERRRRMEWSFRQLGVDYKLVKAVDGKSLNDSTVKSRGIQMLANYADPYAHRVMTMGEIGCFLSHMSIWKEIVERKLATSIIFEDDIRFMPHFRAKVKDLMSEAARLQLDWDLMYIGRKRLAHQNETMVPGSNTISTVGYSYWTLSYVLSQRGAVKLLMGEPLERLVPVDEYLPIMFNRHPEKRWAEAFPNRNLKAYSASPLLVYPTQYTGEPGYFSDTEASKTIPEDLIAALRSGTAGASSSKGAKESLANGAKPVQVVLASPQGETGETGLHSEL